MTLSQLAEGKCSMGNRSFKQPVDAKYCAACDAEHRDTICNISGVKRLSHIIQNLPSMPSLPSSTPQILHLSLSMMDKCMKQEVHFELI
jgi:hypothetical protein